MLFKEKLVSGICFFITAYFFTVATKGIFGEKYVLSEILNFYGLSCFVLALAIRPSLFFADIVKALSSPKVAKPIISRKVVNILNLTGLVFVSASLIIRLSFR